MSKGGVSLQSPKKSRRSPKEVRKTPKKTRRYEIIAYICTMKQKLTAKEEQLMTIFWEHGDLFIRDLVALLPEPRPHYNTVATLVKFLEEKGFLEREPMANTFRYHVKVSEKQYRGETVGEVVAQYYNNSYASLVSQFVEEDKMDIQELKDLIVRIESQRKK